MLQRSEPIRILIVDDSPFYAQVFKSEIHKVCNSIIDVENSSLSVLQRLLESAYDLILLDVIMPEINGITLLRSIQDQYSTIPVCLMSSAEPEQLIQMGFDTSHIRGVQLITKPSGRLDMRQAVAEIFRKSGVLTNLPNERTSHHSSALAIKQRRFTASSTRVHCIGIVSSTGGPQALIQVLGQLPADYPIPILLVQHMSVGFVESFVQWLSQQISMPVNMMVSAQPISSGVWVAPHNAHLIARGIRMDLDTLSPPCEHFKPSGTVLLRSIAKVYQNHGLGIVLTGLGRDGAEGIQAIHQQGGTTIVQEPDTCVIPGMVRASLALCSVDYCLAPMEIAAKLLAFSSETTGVPH